MKHRVILLGSLCVMLLMTNACDQASGGHTNNNLQASTEGEVNTNTQSGEQSVGVPAKVSPSSALTDTKSKNRILRFWRDNSTSMSEDAYLKALDRVLEDIQHNTDKLDGVEVVEFGKGHNPLWSEQPVEFLWGPPPSDKFVEPDPNEASLEEKLYSDSWKERVVKVRADFDAEHNRKAVEHQRLVTAKLKELRTYLSTTPTEPARCTRFDSLATRIFREDIWVNIVLTDGWNDCGDQVHPKNVKEMRGGLLFILVPRRADTEADEGAFEQRESEMQRFFPKAKILPSYLAKGALSDALMNK